VAPVGDQSQHLTLARRTDEGLSQTTLEGVRFVPLVREGKEEESQKPSG
jgi:protein-L-isoaspartate O-methyltransferase